MRKIKAVSTAKPATVTPAKPAKPSTRKIAVANAVPLGAAAAAQIAAGRSNVASPKPAAIVATPASKPAKPAAAPAKPTERKPSGNIMRTASTIAAMRANFGELSERDSAYLAFYAGFAKAAPGGTVTVRAIAESGVRCPYAGSNKAHDAGVIERLTKAGHLASAADGHSFTFTKAGQSRAEYTKAAKRA